MQAVVLVGGQGTRLRPLTANRPKPLLPIANQPFIASQLRRLREQGVDEVILAVQYLADQFVQTLGDGSSFGLKLHIIEEPAPRGTAGAVKYVAHLLHGPTFILNGDTVTDLDLAALQSTHRHANAVLTLALTEVADPTSAGMVECDPEGRVQRFVEKPRAEEVTTNRVNAGSYVIDPSILELVPPDQPASFERDLFPALIAKGAPVYGFSSDAYVGDFGTPKTYLAVHEAILSGRMRFALPDKQFADSIWLEGEADIDPGANLTGPLIIGNGARIDAGTTVSGPTVLGAGSIISAGATIEGSVLWKNVETGEGVTVRHSVLADTCRIGSGTIIEERTVLGDGCIIGNNNHLARGVRLWPGVYLPDNAIAF